MKNTKKLGVFLSLAFSLFFLVGCNAWPAKREAAITEEQMMEEAGGVKADEEVTLSDEEIEGMTDEEFQQTLEEMDEVWTDEEWSEVEVEAGLE